MGRKPKSGSWKYFGVAINAAGKKVAVCDHCNWESTINATRLTDHIISRCQKIPQHIRDEVLSLEGEHLQKRKKKPSDKVKIKPRKKKASTVTDLDTTDPYSPVDSDGVNRYMLPSSSGITPPGPPAFPDRMKPEEQDLLRSMFANAVYASGTPFSTFENPAWDEFFARLRPTFKVPSRFDLSGNLLDQAYTNLCCMPNQKLGKTEALGISIDSMSNIFLFTPEPLFLKSIKSGNDAPTGEHIAKQLQRVIEEKGDYKFMGVATDIGSNMKLAGKMLEEKFPWISWYGCFTDCLNRLHTDVCNEIPCVKEVVSVCAAITAQINGNAKVLNLFREKQKAVRKRYISLRIPGKTRFASNNRCIQAVLSNQSALHALATDIRLVQKNGKKTEYLLSTEVKEEILDEDFWKKIDDVLKIIEPVERWRFQFQSNDIPFSHVLIAVKEVSDTILKVLDNSDILEDDEPTIKALVSTWKEMCLQPIHYAATRLDPSTCDSLTQDESVLAWNYLSKVVSSLPDIVDNYKVKNEVMENYVSFTGKQGVFAQGHLWQMPVKPHVWWKDHFGSSVLGQIASRILFLPPSSAIVNQFTARGRIQSKVRFGFQSKRAEKLVYLHQNLKLLKRNKPNEESNYEQHCANYDEADNGLSTDFDYMEVEPGADNDDYVNDVEAETYIVIYDETVQTTPHHHQAHVPNGEVHNAVQTPPHHLVHVPNGEPHDASKAHYVPPYIPNSG